MLPPKLATFLSSVHYAMKFCQQNIYFVNYIPLKPLLLILKESNEFVVFLFVFVKENGSFSGTHFIANPLGKTWDGKQEFYSDRHFPLLCGFLWFLP